MDVRRAKGLVIESRRQTFARQLTEQDIKAFLPGQEVFKQKGILHTGVKNDEVAILAISNRAQQRLHRVNRRMRARGKPHNVTVVACARELACFLWAAATAN